MAPPFGEGPTATAADDRDAETAPATGAESGNERRSDEFAAVILAATPGARLFPLTATDDDDDDDFDDVEVEGGEDVAMADASKTEDGTMGAGENKDADDRRKKTSRAPPKHLLPLAGEPILCRLLRAVRASGMGRAVVAISSEDDMTVEALKEMGGCSVTSESNVGETAAATSTSGDDDEAGGAALAAMLTLRAEDSKKGGGKAPPSSKTTTSVSVLRLPPSCSGSADALRRVTNYLPAASHAVVLPGDLILASHLVSGAENPLALLADAHRRNCGYDLDGGHGASFAASAAPPAAVTMLLADVGDEDEAGLPLKESSKAKKGGLSRDEEDIEFIGLSPLPVASVHQPSRPRRVVVKASKTEVEEDEDLTGSTPKLVLPKGALRRCCSSPPSFAPVTVRTDLSDLHAYCLSPWVLTLLAARPGLVSLQTELMPLLVGRQFRGAASALGSRALERPGGLEALDAILSATPFTGGSGIGDDTPADDDGGPRRVSVAIDMSGRGIKGGAAAMAAMAPPRRPFSVSAQVLTRGTSKLTLRACTVPAYLYACREAVATAVRLPPKAGAAKKHPVPSSSAAAFLPEGSTVQGKVGSALLPGSEVGDKVKVQSSTVGRRSKLGNRCRLNNVVVMDDVTVGDNTVLQNSVLGAGSTVGENCNLNDCQVGPGAVVPPGSKDKGETFMR